MTRAIVGRTFEKPIFGHAEPFRDLVVRDCVFTDCFLNDGYGGSVERTRPVESVSVVGARCARVRLESLALRQVTVDGCAADPPTRVVNCLFDRVVMRGDVGAWHVSVDLFTPQLRADYAAFYADVEWALDLREAYFTDAVVRGIPVDKVRRDPSRQFILRKDRLRADASWRAFPAALVRRIEFWLWLGGDAELLVASDRSARLAAELARFDMLRAAGFAD